MRADATTLCCAQGHTYPTVEGIPVLLRDDVSQTIELAARSIDVARNPERHAPLFLHSVGVSEEQREIAGRLARNHAAVDPVVAVLVGATCGHAYNHLVGTLQSYPIPEIRLPQSDGERLLDVGCSWGRWCIAAAKKGYRVTGVDPSLGALIAAQRVSRSMGLHVDFVCADARYLPFSAGTFDRTFSYSVLQHFDKTDARIAISEMSRVLKDNGSALVQMAHTWGVRSVYHQLRRGRRAPSGFEVRYWDRSELRETFEQYFRRQELSVHCFFGLGLEKADAALVTRKARAAIMASELLRQASHRFPPLSAFADSLYVSATK